MTPPVNQKPKARWPDFPPQSFSGRRFGKLVAVSLADSIDPHHVRWLCVCDCGTETVVQRSNLVIGHTKSCGCLRRTHGMTKSPEFKAHNQMINRCRKNAPQKKYYADQGVEVCEAWRNSFTAFLSDVGKRPSPLHSLDRFPDCNGHYEPGNVRWATREEQANNKRNSKFVTIGALTLTLEQWSRKVGRSSSTIVSRVRTRRISLAEAISSYAR